MTSAGSPYDAFISHASEDKDSLVRPLAATLRGYGARVWYDEFELRPGDSIVAKLDHGLAQSRHGILVLSPAFLGKQWPEYERQGLTARDVASEGTVLVPVWHGVTAEEVAVFSPTLAQRLAVITASRDIGEVALDLLQVICPDLAEAPLRRALYHQRLEHAERRVVPLARIDRSPPRHATLPEQLLRRIRLINEAVYEVFPRSFQQSVEDYRRDLHPEDEIEVWESIAGSYLGLARVMDLPHDALDARHELFVLLLGGHSGQDVSKLATPHLDPKLADKIRAAFADGQRSDPLMADDAG